jgi:hypothetical protein
MHRFYDIQAANLPARAYREYEPRRQTMAIIVSQQSGPGLRGLAAGKAKPALPFRRPAPNDRFFHFKLREFRNQANPRSHATPAEVPAGLCAEGSADARDLLSMEQ